MFVHRGIGVKLLLALTRLIAAHFLEEMLFFLKEIHSNVNFIVSWETPLQFNDNSKRFPSHFAVQLVQFQSEMKYKRLFYTMFDWPQPILNDESIKFRQVFCSRQQNVNKYIVIESLRFVHSLEMDLKSMRVIKHISFSFRFVFISKWE